MQRRETTAREVILRELLTRGEVAEMLGVTQATVRNMELRGTINRVEFNDRVFRYSWRDVAELKKSRKERRGRQKGWNKPKPSADDDKEGDMRKAA